MRRVTITCRGASPLMMDRMSEETLESLNTGVRQQLQKDRPTHEKAAEKIYRNKEGKIGLTADMFLAAMVGAGRNVKDGKKQISTASTTRLYDMFTLETDFLVLTNGRDDQEPTWVPDARRGVSNQAASSTAVCVVRPRFDEWAFQLTFTYDDKKTNRDTIAKVVKEAGSSQGLGSFRPNRKGRYGRFTVQKWDEVAIEGGNQEMVVTVNGQPVKAGAEKPADESSRIPKGRRKVVAAAVSEEDGESSPESGNGQLVPAGEGAAE